MKIHLRFDDDSNPKHSKMTLFVNGQNSGRIIMGVAEATWFHYILSNGIDKLNHPKLKDFEFISSGSQNISDEEYSKQMEKYSKKWNENT